MIKDFRKTEKKKKIINGQFSFFGILQLPHTVHNFKFWKIDPPYCVQYKSVGTGIPVKTHEIFQF